LVEMAEREGVSLNTYVNVALGKTVGQERKTRRLLKKSLA